MNELPQEVFERVEALVTEGDDLLERGQADAALARYKDAWLELPEPAIGWASAQVLLAAMADARFIMGDHQAARADLLSALATVSGSANPYLHLRLGQVSFELDDETVAAQEFARAYGLAGWQIFEGEDPKYLDFFSRSALGRDG